MWWYSLHVEDMHMLLSLVELHDYQVHRVYLARSWRENSLLSIPETLVELNCIACPQCL